jgi:hypothetical protein
MKSDYTDDDPMGMTTQSFKALSTSPTPATQLATSPIQTTDEQHTSGVQGAMDVPADEAHPCRNTNPTTRTREFLNVINELRVQGQEIKSVKEAEFNGRWERLRSVMDSGASITVIPPNVGKLYEVRESPASKAGVQYQVANGDELPNLGEKFLPLLTSEHTTRGMLAQVADVTMALQSPRALHATGHMVILDGANSFVLNKFTGEVNVLEDDGINYLMDTWIIPPEELPMYTDPGFPGQH